MESLIFSLNATVPVFLMVVVGMLLKKVGWMDEGFAQKMNQFMFRVPLPVLVFSDLATVDFTEVWDLRFVAFCFGATVLSIAAAAGISCMLKDGGIQGEFIQTSYRSSAALLGIALIENIYGNAGMAPLMILASVPLYNVMAVVVLSFFRPGQPGIDRATLRRTLREIATNPIIVGIAAGLLWSLLRLPMPYILGKTVKSIGSMATPVGLIAMGATFDLKKALGKRGPALLASAIKLVGFCAVFLPAAVACGFRREKLIAILIMLGSATTVSSYVMARNMGHEGVLSSSVVMLTTMLSAFTITTWLYLLRSFGLV